MNDYITICLTKIDEFRYKSLTRSRDMVIAVSKEPVRFKKLITNLRNKNTQKMEMKYQKLEEKIPK